MKAPKNQQSLRFFGVFSNENLQKTKKMRFLFLTMKAPKNTKKTMFLMFLDQTKPSKTTNDQ